MRQWNICCAVAVMALSLFTSPCNSLFLPMGVSLLRSLDGYNGSSAAIFKEKIRSTVANQLQSISQELLSFNKELTDLTDSFAVSVKTVTSDIKSKASMQVRDQLERVRSKLNETVSSFTGATVRPVVLHYVDGHSLTLDCLKHLLRAQRRLQQAGYQYHILYSHDARKPQSNGNVAMLEGLFTDDTLSIIAQDQVRQFLERHFTGFSGYYVDQQAVLMDYIVLYWLSMRGLIDVSASGASASAVSSSSSAFPPYVWVLDGGLLWQGDLSRLIASLTDDPLFPADYLVLPRDAFQTTKELHFGPLDRRRVYRDVSRDLQRLVQNLLPSSNFSSILTPWSAATNLTHLVAVGNTLLSLLPSRRNESDDLIEASSSSALRNKTNTVRPTWSDQPSSMTHMTKRLQPHPWIVRYSATFFQALAQSLQRHGDATTDAVDATSTAVHWQSLHVRTPLVVHLLQHRVDVDNGGVCSTGGDGADRGTAATVLAWLSRTTTNATRLVCADLSPVVRQKHLFTSSWQAHANVSAAIYHSSAVATDDDNDNDGQDVNGDASDASSAADGAADQTTSTADFFYLSSP